MQTIKPLAYRAFCRFYRLFRGERAYRRWLFEKVYRHGLWGADGTDFFSGVGSRGEVAALYVVKMGDILERFAAEQGTPLTIVDLGCGDFEIGKRLMERLPDAIYVGCDIVPDLITRNNAIYGTDRISFRLLDIVVDPLPVGDVCLVRQVLQHLSNAEIARFLRAARYARVYVTEGQPEKRIGPANPDKPAGETVRFDWATGTGGGVQLDKPPFGIKVEEIFRATIPFHEIIVTERAFVKPL